MVTLRAARTSFENLGRTQVDFEQIFFELVKGALRMVNVLLVNLRKVATEMWRYLPNTLSMVVTFYAIFLMFVLGIQVLGTPENAATNTQYVIVSTALWFLVLMAMQGISWEVTQEAMRGTLEQLYMSPVGAWRILLARMIGRVLANLIIIVLMLLSMATARQRLNFDLLTLAPVAALNHRRQAGRRLYGGGVVADL